MLDRLKKNTEVKQSECKPNPLPPVTQSCVFRSVVMYICNVGLFVQVFRYVFPGGTVDLYNCYSNAELYIWV